MQKNWFTDVIAKDKLLTAQQRVGREGLHLLYPPFRERVLSLEAALDAEGLPFKIFETFRSQVMQLKMFNNKATKVVTSGMHFYGLATDFVPKINGDWNWKVPREMWLRFGAMAKAHGLVWGGDWRTLQDCPHVQGVTVAGQDDVRAGRYPEMPAGFDSIRPDVNKDGILTARVDIVKALRPVYGLITPALLSIETQRALNAFRHSPELREIEIAKEAGEK